MLTLLLGPPRSGKTYKAVNDIYEEYLKFKKKENKYRFIYTNIVGLKFDEFEGYVKPFNKTDFFNATIEESVLNSQHESGFLGDITDYDKYAYEKGIYKNYHHTLIVLDEAYNTFTKEFNNSLGRFLSYHGHFGIDVVFLLQSRRQTNREYLVHTELMYMAQPSGKRILSRLFRYKVYSTYLDYQKNYIKSENLRFNPKISNLYNSGSTKIYKSYATGKIIFLLLIIFISYFGYKFLKPKPAKQETIITDERFKDINRTNQDIKEPQLIQNSDLNLDLNTTIFNDKRTYLKITCYSHFCKFRNYSLDLSLNSFLELISSFDCYIFLKDEKSANYVDYYLSCPLDFSKVISNINDLQEVCDENKGSFNTFSFK